MGLFSLTMAIVASFISQNGSHQTLENNATYIRASEDLKLDES